ncbi:hypothetical protein CI109_103608 [Kwoniella shandongensis]|uniref:Uncharacterized protein n=1 Tax=Kwoniella shandongensis TaxID=1734106 RepID=A0A5M6C7K9_9TREE|nr:uncharacterized protein CI109_000700 [Kwoniella shandongensis]KAA5531128.1 hypothetical protein CI109_000700 [Kwoniella shandongensis]
MVTTGPKRLLPVTTFVLSTLLLSIFLPSIVVHAAPSPVVLASRIAIRHEDEDGHDIDGMGMSAEHDVEAAEAHTHAATIVVGIPAVADNITESTANDVHDMHSHTDSEPPSHSDSVHAHGHAVAAPDPHSHGVHTPAVEKLNDTAIHLIHHYPPSYLAADFRLDNDTAIFGEEFDATWNLEEVESHKGLMFVHAGSMVLAYFAALPISLALRAADHPSHYFVNLVFLAIAIVGWLAGATYKAASVDRYEGSVYGTFVNILILTSIALTVFDSLSLIKRSIAFYKQHDRSWSSFVHEVLRSPVSPSDEKWPANRYEMVGLVDNQEPEEVRGGNTSPVVFAVGDDEDEEHEHEHEYNHHDHHDLLHHPVSRTLSKDNKPQRPSLLTRQWSIPSRTSTGSEGTLQDTPGSSAHHGFPHKASQLGAFDVHSHDHEHDDHHDDHPAWQAAKTEGPMRAVEIALTWVRRSQIVFAYVTLIIGFVTYTGMCRASLINSCAAHYIKGSIFFWYGVLTFARYLGAYADLGWAWNRRPGPKGVSAEMIECSVIFVYGVTNTWMERFGAKPDDPYTVKQVQHISIAVMFWFAGLSGILLESRWVRKVLGSVVTNGREGASEPPSYAFSFNPLPALVIGVTGLAMAAHHQTYVFQVQIHSLWGTLLAGGSIFRCLTYFFLWLRPPIESKLPSRPPTEIITSFGWAAGGIVFMLSNEEIAWSAMRAGWDDMMAFLNFTIALTSLVFCWSVVILAVKGWAVLRGTRGVELRSRKGDESA